MPTDSDKPLQTPPVSAIGIPGYGRTIPSGRGQVLDEFHPRLRGRQAIRMYREMADNSSILGAALTIIEGYITQAAQKLDAADDTPQAAMCRDKIDEMLDDMATTRTAFLSDVLTECWAGFAWHEMTYKVRRGPNASVEWLRSKHGDGLYGIACIESRAQETIQDWRWDEHGRVVGAYQVAPPRGETRYLPLDGSVDGAPVQCVHFKIKNARGNPEGRSLFRNAYLDYWRLKRIYEFESIGIEKDLAGTLVFEVPPEILAEALANTSGDAATTVANLRKVAERARRGEYEGLVIPGQYNTAGEMTGYHGYLMQSGGRRPMDQDAVIKRIESRMAMALLAEGTLLGMQGSGGANRALSDSKGALMAMMITGIARSISETINGVIIPRIMDANGWLIEAAPVFGFGDLEPDDMTGILPAISSAIGAGAIVNGPELDRWIRDRVGIPHEADVTEGMLADRVGATLESEATQQEPQEISAQQPDADDDGLTDEQEDDAEDAIDRGLSAEEAAAMVGVSPSVIRAAIARGQLPGAKVGRSARVLSSDLKAYMRGGRK